MYSFKHRHDFFRESLETSFGFLRALAFVNWGDEADEGAVRPVLREASQKE